MTYEQLLTKVDQNLKKLETGQAPLQEALELFTEVKVMMDQAFAILANAEKSLTIEETSASW